jgi:hypothetical protein
MEHRVPPRAQPIIQRRSRKNVPGEPLRFGEGFVRGSRAVPRTDPGRRRRRDPRTDGVFGPGGTAGALAVAADQVTAARGHRSQDVRSRESAGEPAPRSRRQGEPIPSARLSRGRLRSVDFPRQFPRERGWHARANLRSTPSSNWMPDVALERHFFAFAGQTRQPDGSRCP